MGVPVVGVGALGLMPLFTAWLGVELVAASFARWRPLRLGEGRVTLTRAAERLAMAIAGVQALTLAVTLRELLELDLLGLWAVTLMAGFAVQLALARWIDRAGVGAGAPLLLVLPELPAMAEALISQVRPTPGIFGQPNPLPALGVGFALVAAIATTRWRPSDGLPARLPLCGLIPVTLAVPLGAWLLTRFDAAPDAPGLAGATGLVVPVFLALISGLLLARIWSPAAELAALGPAEPDTRTPLRRSLLYVIGLTVLQWTLEQRHGLGAQQLVAWTVAGLLVADFVAEIRARAAHPDLVCVWSDHRCHLLAAAEAELEARGVPTLVRHAGYRAATRTLGCFAPLELWVPAGRAEVAREVVGALGRRLEAA